MSVLKDKAATALYGEKARNGVIVITLKGADIEPATSESNGKRDDAEQTAANAIAIKKMCIRDRSCGLQSGVN